MNRRQVEGAVLVAISSIAFGSLGALGRMVRDAGFTVPTMLAVRFAGGAVVLWALAVASREVATRAPRRTVLVHLFLGALYVAEAYAYFESAMRIPVALTALLLYVYPALVAVLSRVVLEEPLTPRRLVAVALSVGGVALSVGAPGGRLDVAGVVLGLTSAAVYSVYILVGSRVSGVPPGLGAAWVTTVAGGLFFLLGPVPTKAMLEAALWPLLALVLVGTALPVPLLLVGLRRLGPVGGAVVSSIEPVAAGVFGALLLAEDPGLAQLVGGVLVIAAVLLISTAPPAVSRGNSGT